MISRKKYLISIITILFLITAAVIINSKLNLITIQDSSDKNQNVMFAQFQSQKDSNNDEIY